MWVINSLAKDLQSFCISVQCVWLFQPISQPQARPAAGSGLKCSSTDVDPPNDFYDQ